MKNVTKTDDKQLWRVADVIDDKPYSWPLFCTPCVDDREQQFMLVEPAVPVGSVPQRNFVHDRINPASASASDGMRWLVRLNVLEKVAHRCAGCTPKFYLVWPGEYEGGAQCATHERPLHSTDTSPDEDFVSFAANYSGEMDIPRLNLAFNIIAYNAVRWLFGKHKPLNLGFCTLHAVPYRANWMAILHARWPNIAAALNKPDEEERKHILETIGFTPSLFSTDLIEMRDNGSFGWTLEVVPSDALEKEVLEIEKQMLEKSIITKVSYLGRWSRLVKSKLTEVLYVFSAWVKKAAAPVGTVDGTRDPSEWTLLPKRVRGRVRPFAPPPPDTYYRTSSHESDGHPPSHPILDEKAIAGVQDVSDDYDIEIGMGMRRRRGVAGGESDDPDDES